LYTSINNQLEPKKIYKKVKFEFAYDVESLYLTVKLDTYKSFNTLKNTIKLLVRFSKNIYIKSYKYLKFGNFYINSLNLK
jgi:hypothetical protein